MERVCVSILCVFEVVTLKNNVKCFAPINCFATFLLIQNLDPITMYLKVVTNEKLGVSGSWLVFEDDFRSPWSETIFEH